MFHIMHCDRPVLILIQSKYNSRLPANCKYLIQNLNFLSKTPWRIWQISDYRLHKWFVKAFVLLF